MEREPAHERRKCVEMLTATDHRPGFYLYWFAAFAFAITAIRIGALIFSDANLGPDETQYWFWSQTPAHGYFSKPPMIAWAIAATTALFGETEWAIRLPAPLFQLGASMFLFALGKRLYDSATGFWAAAGWLTLPGVMLSSMLITTDAPLLFFWSAALYFFFHMLDARADQKGGLKWAALLGLSIGLGLLSKYAMAYFFPCAILALIISRFVRANLRWKDAGLAVLVALIVFTPNILWNAENNFQTLSHTAANANWNDNFVHPVELAKFLGAQIAVIGPITIFLLIWAVIKITTKPRDVEQPEHFALLAFTVVPVLVVCAQAFLSRAHANWAAVAYPAGVALLTAWALQTGRTRLLGANVGVNLLLGLVLMANFVSFPLADSLGASRGFQSVRGWDEQGRKLASAAAGVDAILIDRRDYMGAMLYYARTPDAQTPPIVAWDSNNSVDHHYEAFHHFDPDLQKTLLLVSDSPVGREVEGAFGAINPAGELTVDLKGGRYRTLYLFELSGYIGH